MRWSAVRLHNIKRHAIIIIKIVKTIELKINSAVILMSEVVAMNIAENLFAIIIVIILLIIKEEEEERIIMHIVKIVFDPPLLLLLLALRFIHQVYLKRNQDVIPHLVRTQYNVSHFRHYADVVSTVRPTPLMCCVRRRVNLVHSSCNNLYGRCNRCWRRYEVH